MGAAHPCWLSFREQARASTDALQFLLEMMIAYGINYRELLELRVREREREASEAPHRVAHPISYRGIVGSTMPRVRTFGFRLTGGWRLLLRTDGISARFDLASLAPSETASGPDALQTLADAVLAGWGQNTDDATVVIVSPAAHTYALDARTPAGPPG